MGKSAKKEFEKKGRKSDRRPRARQVWGKSGRWLFLFCASEIADAEISLTRLESVHRRGAFPGETAGLRRGFLAAR